MKKPRLRSFLLPLSREQHNKPYEPNAKPCTDRSTKGAAMLSLGAILVCLAVSAIGCGGGNKNTNDSTPATPQSTPQSTPQPSATPTPIPTPLAVTIMLSPNTATVSPLATQQFTPFVGNTGDVGITYNIVEGASGGTIGGDGLYTAPLIPGTYHVTITSHDDPSKSAAATITVVNQVTLTPDAKTVTLGDTITFTASVPGAADQSVTWKVQEANGGSISQSGVYVAPRVAGTFHVYAVSVEDSAKGSVATITVQAGSAKGNIN